MKCMLNLLITKRVIKKKNRCIKFYIFLYFIAYQNSMHLPQKPCDTDHFHTAPPITEQLKHIEIRE